MSATVQYNSDTSSKCNVSPDTFTRFYNGTTITITASSGYHFTSDSSPYLSWLDTKGSTRTTNTSPDWFNKSLSADGKTITIVSKTDFSTDISVLTCMQTSEHPIEPDTPSYPTLTLTKNLSNVAISPDVSSIAIDGTSKVITLTANSGYAFSGVPKLTISGTDYDFILSNGVYALDVNNIGISSNVSGTITASANEVSRPVLTITKNLSNVTMTPDVSSITIDGTSKVITLTANSGCTFSGVPKLTISDTDYDFDLSNGVYTLDVNDLNIMSDVTGTITATATAKTKDVVNQLSNCSVTPSFTVMVVNETYNLTLNANHGYKFVSTPQLKIKNRDYLILDFTKVTDYQYTLSFTAEIGFFNTNVDAVLSGVAIEETPIVNKYGAIQVYRPSTSDMTSLATKRFKQNGTVDGITYNDVDLGSYITQFKRVFFNIATSSKNNILLGANDTQINTDVVNDDDVTIDCGSVLLTGANGNELDTKIYKIKIVLPFYEVVELPSTYMNKTIHIVYQANVITGYADILINEVVSNTDLLIVKYRCKISQDLPYILDYDKLNSALSDMQLNTSPKIILQKNNTFIDKGYTTFKEGLISNETGYFEVKDIVSMSLNATQKEKDQIENLLKTGVYL